MRSRHWLILVAALGSSCAAYLVVDNFAGDLIKAPHDKHRAAKVECLACHEEVYDAKTLDGNYRPAEGKCLECHKEEKAKGNCAFCHTDVKHARAYPKRTRTLKLSHAAHIEAVKEDCARCHKVLPEPVRRRDATPTMAACLGCHQHRADYDEGRCDVCHVDLARYPLKPLSDFSHAGDYVKQHGRDARASVDTCANCHEQTFCADCHARTVSTRIELKFSERVQSDFIHRGDYLVRHALDARSDPASCSRCHGATFCEGCHAAQDLTSRGPNPRDPHPPGWSLPGAAQFHGPAARRDISACAACHDQGPRSTCINCHKVGGIGGNPHPAGYGNQHPREEMRRNGMCLYCHG